MILVFSFLPSVLFTVWLVIVCYDGYFSHVNCGKRKNQNADEWILFILEIWMLGLQSVKIEGP